MAATLPNVDNLRNSTAIRRAHCPVEVPVMDDLDRRLLALFAADPRVGVLQASRRLGIARGTAQARLDKLSASGVVTGWGPELSPEALGFPVTAFLTLEIRQDSADHGGHDAVARHLATIPEVLEAHTITGAGDLWARVVARSNSDLQRVIDLVLKDPAIVRSSTVIALATQIPYRVLPLAGSG
jgi:DNA-binding Lrp family transcriptional regulator